MSKVKFIRKRDALFRTVQLIINDNIYKLKWHGSVEVDLPDDTYNISIRLDYWWYADYKIDATGKGKEFVISQVMPDWYFWISMSIIIILYILTMMEIIPLVAFTTPLGVYYIPLMVNLIVNRRKFFKLKLLDEKILT
ncbi:MAG: hypothetical protein LBN74_06670 [Prevotella sp.]|jgi:hypothetical protein|nr:hypothetical protein [Prevotella sp.]